MSTSKQRIKQIRQKTSSGYSSGIPIGADGFLIDMLSQLDLEEELKLGGNHYADIQETDTEMTITEYYFSEARGQKSISDMAEQNLITYTVKIKIASVIDDVLWDGVDQFITSQPNGDYLVARRPVESGEEKIEMALYEGYDQIANPKILHSKTIFIYENTSGRIVVDEQIGINPNSDNPLKGNNEGGNAG